MSFEIKYRWHNVLGMAVLNFSMHYKLLLGFFSNDILDDLFVCLSHVYSVTIRLEMHTVTLNQTQSVSLHNY